MSEDGWLVVVRLLGSRLGAGFMLMQEIIPEQVESRVGVVKEGCSPADKLIMGTRMGMERPAGKL